MVGEVFENPIGIPFPRHVSRRAGVGLLLKTCFPPCHLVDHESFAAVSLTVQWYAAVVNTASRPYLERQ